MKSMALFFCLFVIILVCSSSSDIDSVQIQQPKNLRVINNTNTTQQNNQNKNCVDKLLQNSAIGGLIGGGSAATVSAVSGAAISSTGFTTAGVAAGSAAAATQSTIGVVSAGSWFSCFQSIGALGQGVFGAYALPVIVGAAVIGAGGYVAYECLKE